MDRKATRKTARDYKRIRDQISRLLRRFTPIDPNDQFSLADDYEDWLDKIVSVLLRDADRQELLSILQQVREEAGADPDFGKDNRIADAVLTVAETGKLPPNPELQYCLYLREDLGRIESYLVEQIRAFDPVQNRGPGASQLISQITVGFECLQAGWVVIVFDTRPNPTNDGEWTSHLDPASVLTQDHWIKALTANFRGPIEIVDAHGIESRYPEDKAVLVDAVGGMISGLIVTMRDKGLFSALPVAPDVQFFVEDFEGEFVWTDSESDADSKIPDD